MKIHLKTTSPKNVKLSLVSLRELIFSIWPFIVVTLVLLIAAYWALDPNPPKHVVLATGPEQSAYDNFGKRYAQALAQQGIKVELRVSQGSSENLQLLREGKVDLGFVQSGSDGVDAYQTQQSDERVMSLGSLFVEPVWLFYRADAAKKISKDATLSSLTQLKGLKVNVGTAGSGVPNLMNKLFELNQMEPDSIQKFQLEQTPSTMAFLAGELDVLVFASAPESQLVQMLLLTPGVKLMSFDQSEAYARRLPYLSPVQLPHGILDLAKNLPEQDVRLIASTTALISSSSTHPALIQLFSQASQTIHGAAGWFNEAREYPNAKRSEFTMSKEALRNLQVGASFLQRYLPFWMANLIERMGLALGVIAAIMLPASRIIPPLYIFRIRSRIFRWYGQLRTLESQLASADISPEVILKRLNELDEKVMSLTVPLSYTDELYALRNNIGLVKLKLLERLKNQANSF